ncbi:MAG: hypothetical protein CMH49_05705 [Myxococcales bacterium]|nr:hypothetical protein [Myxococcales bacterium]
MYTSKHPIFLNTHSNSIMNLTRKLTLGMVLFSGVSLHTACSPDESVGFSENSTSYSEQTTSNSRSNQNNTGPNAYDDGYSSEAQEVPPGMNSDRSEAITENVEVTYNDIEDASHDNQLTFAVDVDTASYTIARDYLNQGMLPPKEVIRVEEFINFFDYTDAAPESLEENPFAVHLDAAKAPFAQNHTLLRVGLKGFEVANEDRPETNLVFLVDTSGSMSSSIQMVRDSLGLLLDNLNPTDTIAIVTYAGNSKIALRPTQASNRETILNAMSSLTAGGSTNGADGINSAYDLAEDAFQEDGLNRVVLCTDGDFNVGVVGDELYDLIEEKRESGITLSVLGFGNRYNDTQMEQLADRGNGNYTFIDSLREAQRALVDRLTATLMVIAKDVKIQLEVNPTIVKAYRLLGYENRAIADEDFRNDSVDAGEIGAGHGVTALVELELYPQGERPSLEDIGAQVANEEGPNVELTTEDEDHSAATDGQEGEDEVSDEINENELTEAETESETESEIESETEVEQTLFVDSIFAQEDAPLAMLRLRHKTPDAGTEDEAMEQTHLISERDIREDAKRASKQLMFAAAVAEFAEILRESPHVSSADFDAIIELANEGKVEGDEWMEEFITLVETAQSLYGMN